ncbi:hypothetical protein DFJ67_0279 [Asanoa ferruginea]|uniref:Uncharacterized protein n=1 Tax=Asanoa ferruginea TaxID=53367 RepID=A0A3D9ZL23_9ACTN|nr:hypothetical protein [Asanoa ferruginea]REF94360.1 hypothetical protein DFJ67_0279 [Asanoa ferruginea]GIF51128.1 hypothetical protein Afe04nite_56670 [Asanoa ferruginea]
MGIAAFSRALAGSGTIAVGGSAATVVEICCPRCLGWRKPRRFDTHANACTQCKATLAREVWRP